MRILNGGVVGLALLCLFASGVVADETANDVRCLAVSMQFMGSDNSAVKSMAFSTHLYWLGRLDGRTPKLNLEDRIIEASLYLQKPGVMQSEAVRCGKFLAVRGKAEEDMGKRITERGRKMMQMENSK